NSLSKFQLPDDWHQKFVSDSKVAAILADQNVRSKSQAPVNSSHRLGAIGAIGSLAAMVLVTLFVQNPSQLPVGIAKRSAFSQEIGQLEDAAEIDAEDRGSPDVDYGEAEDLGRGRRLGVDALGSDEVPPPVAVAHADEEPFALNQIEEKSGELNSFALDSRLVQDESKVESRNGSKIRTDGIPASTEASELTESQMSILSELERLKSEANERNVAITNSKGYEKPKQVEKNDIVSQFGARSQVTDLESKSKSIVAINEAMQQQAGQTSSIQQIVNVDFSGQSDDLKKINTLITRNSVATNQALTQNNIWQQKSPKNSGLELKLLQDNDSVQAFLLQGTNQQVNELLYEINEIGEVTSFNLPGELPMDSSVASQSWNGQDNRSGLGGGGGFGGGGRSGRGGGGGLAPSQTPNPNESQNQSFNGKVERGVAKEFANRKTPNTDRGSQILDNLPTDLYQANQGRAVDLMQPNERATGTGQQQVLLLLRARSDWNTTRKQAPVLESPQSDLESKVKK
ncbi:MAG: hypothetical protein AAGA30_01980, partial [Planctomycetota bacterium]